MNTFKCWAVVLIAVFLLPNVGASANPAKEAYQKGKACLEKKDLDAAIAAFTEAIRLDPKFAEAYSYRGLVYAAKGEHDKAIAACTEAITNCTEAIRLDPGNAEAYYSRGIAYRIKGDYDKAIGDYTEALRLNPKYAKVYKDRGHSYLDRSRVFLLQLRNRGRMRGAVAHENNSDYDKAIADYTEAIRLDPKDTETYCYRGLAFEQKGEYDKAVADCTEIIRLSPKDIKAYEIRGLAYELSGQFQK
jgi:tetratricopeptide (TPR) repeat protein